MFIVMIYLHCSIFYKILQELLVWNPPVELTVAEIAAILTVQFYWKLVLSYGI